ncbi:hypothetical protein [Comamonas sp.]|uniref:hypothetical protein n=2 Tax=Comamonadaceae TaxID=80864 RepID=UPI0025BAF5B0|nr:hypothetical protein [Comamonas sp.]
MIPGPLFSLPMLLLLLAPWVAAGLSLWLLLRGLLWWRRHRRAPSSGRPPFWRWPVVLVAILALAGDLWGLVLAHKLAQIEEAVTLRAHYRESRQRFVLPEDFRYGEQLFPQGTLINRYDAFDNGERQRPLGLRGLNAARFVQPVRIAGAWVSAIDSQTVELARDQRLGPVFHFDPDAEPGYGAWVVDPKRAYLECRKGDIARLHVPLIAYDIQAEFLVGAPDGPEARYRPSQWGFIDCQAGKPAIEVLPAYDGPAPAGAHLPVWGTLIPNED